MTLQDILIAAAGLATAGLVKGATGIGFSTTALPIIALGIGLERAMPLIIISSMASNVVVVRGAKEFRATLTRFGALFAALVPGLAVGLTILAGVKGELAAKILGVVILTYGLYALARPALTIQPDKEKLLNLPVGFLNGLINGMTGSQIVPIVPYALSLRLTPDGIVQLTNIGFTISSLGMIFGLYRIGLLDPVTFAFSAFGIVPMFAGVTLGTRLRRRIAADSFRKLVLFVLIGLGALLILEY